QVLRTGPVEFGPFDTRQHRVEHSDGLGGDIDADAITGNGRDAIAPTAVRRRPRRHSRTPMYLVSRNSSIPGRPPSRPSPDSFTPPNGAAGFDTTPWFKPTMPVSRASQTRRPRRSPSV